jgi:two-component system response regulator HydG
VNSILIVDDDIKLCATLSEDLNEIGYLTHFVTNVDDALKYIKSSAVDLILLDLKMTDKDGFYLLENLNDAIKIIVLTAKVDIESAVRAAKFGVNDYLLKPFDFDKLLLSIRRVLNSISDDAKIEEV